MFSARSGHNKEIVLFVEKAESDEVRSKQKVKISNFHSNIESNIIAKHDVITYHHRKAFT